MSEPPRQAGRPPGSAKKRRAEAHPGGTGAVLGVRLLRYSGVQGATVAIAAVLQLVTLFVIGNFLGAAELGRYSLLFFLAALITQVITIGTRPGIMRRTFGASDDEEDDEDGGDADEVSASPQRSLGVGLIWTVVLSALVAAVVYLLRDPIAQMLLGDPEAGALIAWAGALGGANAFMRVGTIVLWFEHRPMAYVIADASRPVLSLVGVTILLAGGAGLEGAIAAAAAGAAVSCLVALWLLRGTFVLAIDPRETLRIIARGGPRGPVLTSFWVIQNADVFVLSRFVGDADLGIYMLVSRLGFVGAFLPAGFRMALRPLRKGAIFKAVQDQYGRATQRGQILGYFSLLCITAILAMVLLGRILVDVAPEPFADAAPLIPLAALGMVGPSLLRTVNQQTSWPGKGPAVLIVTTVVAAIGFIAITAALAPAIGIYAAPTAMIAVLLGPSIGFFVRCQRSESRIEFPYTEVATALGVAVLVGAGFSALPDLPLGVELAAGVAAFAAYLALLFVLRVVPEYHWPALAHMARSVVAGRADRFDADKGIGELDLEERGELRTAATRRIASELLEGPGADADRAAYLVAILRCAGRSGGMPVRGPSKHDARIASFLFADAPRAARNATMRNLMADGADSGDLRMLEDLVSYLARTPEAAWSAPGEGERRFERWRERASSRSA